MIDFDAVLYAPVYAEFGIPATIELGRTNRTVGVTVIDRTARVYEGDDVAVSSLRPIVDIRVKELIAKGVQREELYDSRITYNAVTLRIMSHEQIPSPGGEASGEIRCYLAQ